jgi:hypothetical protein
MQTMLPAQTTNAASKQGIGSVVPFVGCQSDGQAGPREAPKGEGKTLSISAEKAQRLAYYKAQDGWGVVAPRGWHCFQTYGSGGSSLFVSPQPIKVNELFSDSWKGFTGPVIQLRSLEGSTSGRFEVARIVARVFPAHRTFVRKVMADWDEPASDFPFGPYPHDKLVYKSKETVEYETPANTDGLGTQSRLQKNRDAIRGLATLVGEESEPSLVFLAVRLPRDMDDLVPIIIQRAERKDE